MHAFVLAIICISELIGIQKISIGIPGVILNPNILKATGKFSVVGKRGIQNLFNHFFCKFHKHIRFLARSIKASFQP